jgi:hypothetical protein
MLGGKLTVVHQQMLVPDRPVVQDWVLVRSLPWILMLGPGLTSVFLPYEYQNVALGASRSEVVQPSNAIDEILVMKCPLPFLCDWHVVQTAMVLRILVVIGHEILDEPGVLLQCVLIPSLMTNYAFLGGGDSGGGGC